MRTGKHADVEPARGAIGAQQGEDFIVAVTLFEDLRHALLVARMDDVLEGHADDVVAGTAHAQLFQQRKVSPQHVVAGHEQGRTERMIDVARQHFALGGKQHMPGAVPRPPAREQERRYADAARYRHDQRQRNTRQRQRGEGENRPQHHGAQRAKQQYGEDEQRHRGKTAPGM